MRSFVTGLVLLAVWTLTGCSTSKTAPTALYGPAWQLEYLSGPRIAFEKLFPEKKPFIAFIEADNLVQGNSGCNGYSAPYTLNGNAVSFGEPGPSTLMYCGEGENFFRNTMAKVNAWTIDDDGKLHLMIDGVTMMRFTPSDTE